MDEKVKSTYLYILWTKQPSIRPPLSHMLWIDMLRVHSILPKDTYYTYKMELTNG